MDKYAIFCIFILIILCIWHSTLGALIFLFTPDFRITSDMWFAYIDRLIFQIALSLFSLLHICFIIWLYRIPLRHRRQMSKKDFQYRQLLKKTSSFA